MRPQKGWRRMATKRRILQEEIVDDARLALIFKLIEDRPAFQGAPELEALLTRHQTAENLVKAGFPVSAKTLATKATRGGGPPYSLFGPRPLYIWRAALVWAHSRMTTPRRSSSEGDSAREGISRHEEPNKLLAVPHSKTETPSRPPKTDPKTDELPVLPSSKVRAR
jgi:hypothetical protein